MGMLAEQLRSIIEGPLGTDEVTEDTVAERVGMVEQNERRHVFGVVVYRDGEDQYFVNDHPKAMKRRDVVEAVKEHLESRGRLLEKFDIGAMMADSDQQKAVDAAEKKIGATFKKIAKRYTQALEKMTGAKWNVVSASESIFSLDSNESPKRAVDIYWEYDPGSQTASIYIEGPKGKQNVYTKQKLSDIPRRNYIDWLSGVLKEDMDEIIFLALDDEESLIEGVLTEKKFSDLVSKNSWAVLLPAVMRDKGLQKELFDLIQTAYKPIGGHLKIKKPSDIPKEIHFAHAIDIDDDPEADATVFGKLRAGRPKLTGMGRDDSSAGKKKAMEKWGKELKSGKAFAEVSGAIAHITLNKLGAKSIGGEEVVQKMLPGKSIEWVGKHPSGKYPGNDNWYRRKIGGKNELKIMVGISAPGKMEKLPKKQKEAEEPMGQALVEEIWGIIEEDAVVMRRRSIAKAPPMSVRAGQKPRAVPSGTKVSTLFKQLVRALTTGGDWDAPIKALRKEGVPEKHIKYAIRYKEVPYIYAEEMMVDDDLDLSEDGAQAEA